MARSPITWRQVSGGQAGNPASAMGAAIQGFGMAGRGALDQVESLRKGEAIRNAELTQRTIGEVMASGKPLNAQSFNDFAPGVNTGEVMKSVLGARATQSDIARNESGIAYDEQRTEQLEYENSPGQREFLRRQDEARTRSLEEQLKIRQAELTRLNAKDAESARKADGVLAIQRGYNSEAPDGLRGRAMAAVEASWENVQSVQYNELLDQGMDGTAAMAQIEAGNPALRERLIQQQMGLMQNEWLQEKNSEWGLDLTDLAKTTPGYRAQQVEAANIDAITKEEQAQRTAEKKIRDDAKKALDKGSLATAIPSGNSFIMGKAGDNTLAKGNVDKYLREDMNIRIDPDHIGKAENILKLVGGNEKAFAEIMNDGTVLTDRDRGLFTPLGDDDDIDWAQAETLARQKAAFITSWLQTQTEEEDVLDTGIMSLEEINRRRAQQKNKKKGANKKTSPAEAAASIIKGAGTKTPAQPPLAFSVL